MDTDVDFGGLGADDVTPVTIRCLIYRLCNLLEKNGEESFFVSVNSKLTIDQHGTGAGRKFLQQNLHVVKTFQDFCGSYKASTDFSGVVESEHLSEEDFSEKLSPLNQSLLKTPKQRVEIVADEKDHNDVGEGNDNFTIIENVEDNEIFDAENTGDNNTRLGCQATELESKICEICGRTYQSKYSLSRHLRICHKGSCKWYTCSECSAKFKEKNLLTRHINHKHTKTIVATCATCGKGFHSSRNLRDHEVVHNGGRYKCKHCGKLFVSKTTLEGHINKYHLKINPFACPHCSREFPYKTSLKYHIKTSHSGSHKVSAGLLCKECGQEFKTRSTYRKHINVNKINNKSCSRNCFKNNTKDSKILQENRHTSM